MSKGCKSRVSNKKQFDDNFDLIQKKKDPKPGVTKRDATWGIVTRYTYKGL